jgi:hypothetical protein
MMRLRNTARKCLNPYTQNMIFRLRLVNDENIIFCQENDYSATTASDYGEYRIPLFEILRNFSEILLNFTKFHTLAKYSLYFHICTLNYSIKRIKLKLLLICKLFTKFAIRNLGNILQNLHEIEKFRRNFAEISYPHV